MVQCPHCRNDVVPWRNPDGSAVCPACRNTGNVLPPVQPPPWGAPPVAMPVQAPPNADGAVLSMVMGILSLTIPYVGFIFAIIGLTSAKKAEEAIAASGHRYAGAGMAKAGRIMSIISLCLYGALIVFFLIVFLFVGVGSLGAMG